MDKAIQGLANDAKFTFHLLALPAGAKRAIDDVDSRPTRSAPHRRLQESLLAKESVENHGSLKGTRAGKFRNTNAYVGPAKFERAVGKSSVTNFELQINDSWPSWRRSRRTAARPA